MLLYRPTTAGLGFPTQAAIKLLFQLRILAEPQMNPVWCGICNLKGALQTNCSADP
jgi:hypothetical protein